MCNKNLTKVTWDHFTPSTVHRQCDARCNRFAWLGWSVVTAKCMPSASNGMVRLYDTCHYCLYQITHSSNVMYTTPPAPTPSSPRPFIHHRPYRSPVDVSLCCRYCDCSNVTSAHSHNRATDEASKSTRYTTDTHRTNTDRRQQTSACCTVHHVMCQRNEHENV